MTSHPVRPLAALIAHLRANVGIYSPQSGTTGNDSDYDWAAYLIAHGYALAAPAREPSAALPVTMGKACTRCGGTEWVCADCNHIVTGEAAEAIRREIREGTPDTPERIATMKRADKAYARSMGSQRPESERRTDLATSAREPATLAPAEPAPVAGPWEILTDDDALIGWPKALSKLGPSAKVVRNGVTGRFYVTTETEAPLVRDALNALASRLAVEQPSGEDRARP